MSRRCRWPASETLHRSGNIHCLCASPPRARPKPSASQSAKSSSIYAHRMRQLFPKLRLCPILKHHALVFVRLAHDRRFVAAVLVLFVLVVFIRISGRHRVAHDHEGTPVDQPGGKFLGDVWGHVVAARVWTLGDFTPSAVIRHANLPPLALQELGAFGRIDPPILNQQFCPALCRFERCFPDSGPSKPFFFESICQGGNCDPRGLTSFFYFGGPQACACLPSHIPDPQPLSPRFRCATNGPGAAPAARNWLSQGPGPRSWTTRDKPSVPENPFGISEQEPKPDRRHHDQGGR